MRSLNRPLRVLVPGVLLVLLVLSGAGPASGDDDPVGVWPLRPEPEVVEHFDPPTSPYGSGHRGVDLLGHAGQRVHTALAGRVTYAGPLAGRGVVVVSHGDTRTTYEPVSAAVSVGDVVGQGAVVGALQSAGSHCAPRACLHWGWLRGETYLDPLRLVGTGPVRLLPLWRDQPVARAPTLPFAGWLPPLRASGAGVSLPVGLPEPVGGDVGVPLRRRE
jgi:murein DD-endopeptidase MepM/ murein hydrolase activator NlpD